MANIMDYLDWRGDIPFSVDPFNEVDNLVLSQLSYSDFDSIVPPPGQGTVSIDEVCDRYFVVHPDEEILAQDTFVKTAPFLLRKMKGSRRFGATQIGGFVNIISTAEEEQMSAVTFYLEDGTIYVAFRGTDNTVVGWKEDFNLSFTSHSPGQISAARYLADYFNDEESKLRVGGHSKGGNFAVYASAFCTRRVKDKIIEVWNNDGPGFLDDVLETDAYRDIAARVNSIIPACSVFGLLLGCGYDHRVIMSDQKGIMQHDAMSWQVLGSHFVLSEEGLTEESLFLEKTIDTWVAGYNMEERENFINLVFNLFSASGAETISEFNAERWKNYLGLVKGYRSMPPQEQKVVSSTLGALVKTGMDTLVTEVREAPVPTAADAVSAVSALIDKLPVSRRAKTQETEDEDGGTCAAEEP